MLVATPRLRLEAGLVTLVHFALDERRALVVPRSGSRNEAMEGGFSSDAPACGRPET
jgi:hypothetical protein